MWKLIEEGQKIVCLICNNEQKNLRGLSQHLKAHQINSKEYTFIYLLNSEIPKCKCGCGKDCLYFPFRFNDYRSGHNPDCFWQNKLDKDSPEFKAITEKISKSVTEYAKENPREVTEETREKHSKRMKETMSDLQERERRFSKMKETKRKQSEDGTLSERHWTKKLTEEELEIKLKEIGDKISEGKRNNPKPAWNKGLTTESDDRIEQWAGENNYRYNPDRRNQYTRKFRNKEFRELILSQQNNICFECKNKDGRQLCLHHVDEDKKNDSFNNLIFVCRSCHIRLHSIKLFMKNFTKKVLLFKEQFTKENF